MLDSPAGSGDGGASRGVVAAVWAPVNGCRPPGTIRGGGYATLGIDSDSALIVRYTALHG